MYGWGPAYFIIVGLLRDGRLDLARDMVNNFCSRLEGIIRPPVLKRQPGPTTLTRSQPPFLTSMILGVYNAQKAAGHEDRKVA